jgi:glycosyltransferase involved in cell wall biosynthesis
MPARSTRIAYVVNDAGLHGAERTVLQLARGLPRGRYEVGVVCSPVGPFVDRLHDIGIPVLAADVPRRVGRQNLHALVRELRGFAPDIVHTMGSVDPAERFAARLTRATAVVSSITELPGPRGARPWREVLGAAVGMTTDRFVDRYVVANRVSVDLLVERLGVAARKVVVIPFAVDLVAFDPARVRRGSWRARLGIPPDAVVLGALGRLTASKGFADLLRAFAALGNCDVWLIIAGEGPEWEELHTLAQAFDIAERALFLGFVDDVPELLSDVDVFVLPSRVQDHPLVLLEAMAMARPIVATDIAGVGDTIADGIEGRLVAAGDVGT